MNIHRTAFKPTSLHPSSAFGTRDALKIAGNATTFTRPVHDRAPGAGAVFPGFPDIDPHAPEAEKEMTEFVNYHFHSGTLPLMGVRLLSLLKVRGNQESRREDFTFRNEPASVQVVYPRTVINVGSEENGTAGQISFVNERMELAHGEIMKEKKVQEHIVRHAAYALGINIARQKNMPFAVAALQGRLHTQTLLNEHGKHVAR